MQIFDTEIFLLHCTFPYILVVHFMSLKSGRHANVTIHLAYRCSSHKEGSGINGGVCIPSNEQRAMSNFRSYKCYLHCL